MNLSLGKRRRLQQATSPRGVFTVLAIDHRGPLRRKLAQEAGVTDADAALAALKQDIVRELGPLCSAVLLDPEFGWSACIASGALPGSTGLFLALDTGSTGDPAVLRTGLVEGWDPARIARAGACGLKLLVYYHPDAPNAGEVRELVRDIGRACEAAELPFYLEPLSFDPGQPATPLRSAERRRVVVETARQLTPLGVDILKAEFPLVVDEVKSEEVWEEACRELTEASCVPWVLLSAGVPMPVFLRQARAACAGGASGVIAGRALWSEAVTANVPVRRQFLAREARARMEQVRDMCESMARPWTGAPAVP